jgi:hypothetical protein
MGDDYSEVLCNFDDFDDSELINYDQNKQSKPICKQYDDRTTEYYRVLRLRKMDPFLCIDLKDEECFKFPYIWDPYTGNRMIEEDSDQPLCFDPDFLIHYFYTNRLNNLWVEPKDEVNGYYDGYYDSAVGAGKNILIRGRGEFPEKYLFRLPIPDCYLTMDHKDMIITMGPILTDDEIKQIYELSEKNPNNYFTMFGIKKPNLIIMKKYYDQALSTSPECNQDISQLSMTSKVEIYNKLNREAVEKLKILK